MSADDGQVTLLLKAMKNGDESAAGKLLPLVYDELHRLAKSYMQRERLDHANTLLEWPRMSCVACLSITHGHTTPR
jgi:hypothetical protein